MQGGCGGTARSNPTNRNMKPSGGPTPSPPMNHIVIRHGERPRCIKPTGMAKASTDRGGISKTRHNMALRQQHLPFGATRTEGRHAGACPKKTQP